MEPQDYISSMPQDVISNILDRLPIQDAVRTDILSRRWRFKWTMVSQLVFDYEFFRYFLGPYGDNDFNGRNLGRLLLHLKGPITKFVLDINQELLDAEDINHWILFVSRNGLKDLTLKHPDRDDLLKLPTQLYSCMELKHLKLINCYFRHSPSFHGYPNLLTLDLSNVRFQSYTFGEFITQCPSVEILKFRDFGRTKEVKLAEIAKLQHLKSLSLSWFSFDDQMVIKRSSLFQLTRLPNLQELALDFWMCILLEEGGIKTKAPAFLYLKTVKLAFIDFSDDIMVSFVFEMIRGSPNLQKLEIEACDNYVSPEALLSIQLDPKTMRQLQLQDVVFSSFRGSENEVWLVRCVLACSPLLKKMAIKLELSSLVGGENEKFKLTKKLLKLHRASPVAEIDISEKEKEIEIDPEVYMAEVMYEMGYW